MSLILMVCEKNNYNATKLTAYASNYKAERDESSTCFAGWNIIFSSSCVQSLIERCKVAYCNCLQKVRDMILTNGFYVVQSTSTVMTEEMAAAFYAEHRNQFFYNRLVTFMRR
jgi:hypothetical protein